MKAVFFAVISLSLLFLQCQSSKSNQNRADNKPENSVENKSFTKKFDDIEIAYSVNLTELSKLTINYEMKNTGAKNYIVFNQGHTNIADKDDAYIEERPDGIEISQKAFLPPADVRCPLTIAPIFPRAASLKASGLLKGQAVVKDLRTHTPYDFCYKSPLSELKGNKARFCIGVSDNFDAIDANGIVRNPEVVKSQKLLCSDEINLK